MSEAVRDLPLFDWLMCAACDLFGAVSYLIELAREVFESSGCGAFECVRFVSIVLRLSCLSLSLVVSIVLMVRSEFALRCFRFRNVSCSHATARWVEISCMFRERWCGLICE